MTFTVLLRRSNVAGHVPTTTQLSSGEIAVNTYDGLLYFVQNVAGANSLVVLGPTPVSANTLTTARTIALSGDATGSVSFNGSANVTIATTLANTTVVPGTYSTVVVNSKGLVTNATTGTSNFSLTASGDVSGTNFGNTITLTLATVNSNVGTFNNIVVNAKGLVTSARVFNSTDITTALGYTPVNKAGDTVTGSLTINNGINVTSGIFLYGTNTTAKQISFNSIINSVTSNRWILSVSGGDYPNGNNTGGDFSFNSYTDNGTYYETPFSITRSTGTVSTGNLNVLGNFSVSGVATSTITLANTDNSTNIATTAFVKNQGYLTTNQNITLSGDVSGTGTNTITTTLATVNSNVGTFNNLVINAKGLVTNARVFNSSDITTALGYTPVNKAGDSVNGFFSFSGLTSFSGGVLLGSYVTAATVANSDNTTNVATTAFVKNQGYLTTNQNITLSGDISGTGTNAITTTLATVNSNVGTFNTLTVNAKGLVTAASNTAYITGVTASGDATGTSTGSALPLTLATVNSNVGNFGNAVIVPAITVNAKGLVTAISNTSIIFPVTSVFGRTGVITLQSSDVTGALGYTPVNNAVVGVANGIATLDGTGKLTIGQLPTAVTGALVYQGTWNASTNTPTLTSGTGTKGQYYKVNVAGTTLLDGNTQWNVGDSVVFDGTTWDKIDGLSNEVISVFGRTGSVTLLSSDVTGALGYTPVGTLVASGDVSGTSSGNTITLTLANIATAGTFSGVVINAKGQVTSGVNSTISGDVTGTYVGPNVTLTLATVNSNVGTFGNTVVVPTITVNAKGLVTAVSSSNIAFPVTSVFGRTGAITLQSSDVTTALGYTPIGTLVASGDVSGTSSGNTITLTLASVTTAGTFAALIVNSKGLVIAGANTVYSGDVSGTSTGANATLTLATVNSNVGTFNNLVINAKGLVTSARVFNSSDITTALGYTPINKAGDTVSGTIIFSGNILFNNITAYKNNTSLGFADTNNNYIQIYVDSSNNLNLIGTNGSGGYRTIFQMAQESNTSALVFSVPVQMGSGATAVTVANTDNTTNVATTAFVKNQGYLTTNQNITLSGDISGTGTNSINATLATVNSNVGTWAGITVNGKGLVTAAANVTTFAGYNLGIGYGTPGLGDTIDSGYY